MKFKFVSKLVAEREEREALSANVELRDLRREVEQAIPGCETAVLNARSAYVYMPDDLITMGMVGYGDFRVRGDGSDMYMVESPYITNNKYHSPARQHHMKMSKNMAPVLKAARAHLRSRRAPELAKMWAHDVGEAYGDIGAALTAELRALWDSVGVGSIYSFMRSAVLAELKDAYRSGYTFTNRAVAQAVSETIRIQTEADARPRALNAYFVHVYTKRGSTLLDIVEVDELGQYSAGRISDTVLTVSPSDVPDDIMGKVATLQMVEDRHYVDGVGYRVMDRAFYVAR